MNERYIFEAFWPKSDGCVFIAFIKAILTLGHDGSVLQVAHRGRYIYIRKPDGRTWCFTPGEIRKLNRGNDLSFRKARSERDKRKLESLKIKVHHWYAVAVRSLQVHGYEQRELTESGAKRLLNKTGMRSSDFHRLLGVQRTASYKLSGSRLRSVAGKKGILLYNDRHIVASASGWYDVDGKSMAVGKSLPEARGRPLTDYFCISVRA